MIRTLSQPRDRSIVFSLSSSLRHLLVAALLIMLVSGELACANGADCVRPTSLPPSEKGQPPNIDGLKSQLTYYECSGAYEREFTRVIDKVISHVLRRATKDTKLAIVLDIDETSLSNWAEIKANNFGFIPHGTCNNLPNGPCADDAWERLADAKVIEPTLKLFKIAKQKNVGVFFITGRRDADHLLEATKSNLSKAGYAGWTDLILRSVDDASTVQEFKTAKRKEIEAKGYTIIANVGDQYSDLKGGYAEQVYKLPNPFYFIP
jgi:hypothetical protein